MHLQALDIADLNIAVVSPQMSFHLLGIKGFTCFLDTCTTHFEVICDKVEESIPLLWAMPQAR